MRYDQTLIFTTVLFVELIYDFNPLFQAALLDLREWSFRIRHLIVVDFQDTIITYAIIFITDNDIHRCTMGKQLFGQPQGNIIGILVFGNRFTCILAIAPGSGPP